jgi:hypothetical protein
MMNSCFFFYYFFSHIVMNISELTRSRQDIVGQPINGRQAWALGPVSRSTPVFLLFLTKRQRESNADRQATAKIFSLSSSLSFSFSRPFFPSYLSPSQATTKKPS